MPSNSDQFPISTHSQPTMQTSQTLTNNAQSPDGFSFFNPDLEEDETPIQNDLRTIQSREKRGLSYRNRVSKFFFPPPHASSSHSDKALVDHLSSLLKQAEDIHTQFDSQPTDQRGILRQSRQLFIRRDQEETSMSSNFGRKTFFQISPQDLHDWEIQIGDMQKHSLHQLRAMRAFSGLTMELQGIGAHSKFGSATTYDVIASYLNEHNTRANREELTLIAQRIPMPDSNVQRWHWQRAHREQPEGQEFEVNFTRKNPQEAIVEPKAAQQIGLPYTLDTSKLARDPVGQIVRRHFDQQIETLDGLSAELTAMLASLSKEDITKARCKSALRHTALIEDPSFKEGTSEDLKTARQKAPITYRRAKIEMTMGNLLTNALPPSSKDSSPRLR